MTNEPVRRPEVSAGMSAARERGVRLGRPPAAVPPAAERADELRREGRSLAEMATILNGENVATPSGKGSWTRSSVQYALRRLDEQRESAAANSSSTAPPADPGA